jgi:hypothetical protein
VSQGVYPAAEHCYEMPEKEKAALTRSRQAAKD